MGVVVSIVIRLWAGCPRNRGSFQAGANYLSLLQNVQTCSGPMQPPTQWVPRTLIPGLNRQDGAADNQSHLAPRLRVSGATPPFTHMPSWLVCRRTTLILHN
jgi:hypothetical protein